LLQLPAVLAGTAIGQGSVLAQVGQLGLGFGLNALLLKYSRSAEEQADALGAQLMAAAGYNPLAMAEFFEKLEAEDKSRAPEFLSSHPDPGDRREDVQKEIQALPQRKYASNQTGSFDNAKQLVAQLPPPDERMSRARAASGGTFTGGAPTSFTTLNTPRFSLAYPADWQVYGDRNSSMITLAPERALLRNPYGGVDVGYGAILSYYQPDTVASIQQSTQEIVQHLVASNPTMSVAASARSIRVDGAQGHVVTLRSASPYGGTEVDLLLTVLRPEGIFYIVFIVPEQVHAQNQNVFDRMAQSLRFH